MSKFQKTVKVNDVFLLVGFDTETEKFSFEKYYKKSDVPVNEPIEVKKPKEVKEEPKEKIVKSDFIFFEDEEN